MSAQLEAMRDILMKAGYTRTAAEQALAEPRRLRDEFAMAALHGILAAGVTTETNDDVERQFAQVSFRFADAMLTARGRA